MSIFVVFHKCRWIYFYLQSYKKYSNIWLYNEKTAIETFDRISEELKLALDRDLIEQQDVATEEVKDEKAKGKTANLWRYRALSGGFNIFEHEYIMIFQKTKLKKIKNT